MCALRKLGPRDLPSSELLRVANNAQYCVQARVIRLACDETRERFYCALTGEPLANDEEVNLVQFVERDAERGPDDDSLEGLRPFERPEFTRSIKAFLFKRTIENAPVSIFHRKEQPAVNHKRPRRASSSTKSNKRARTEQRQSCDAIWREMCSLGRALEQHAETAKFGEREFVSERKQLAHIFGLMNERNVVQIFDKLLVFYLEPCALSEEARRETSCRLFDAILDLIDALQLDPAIETHAVIRRLIEFAAKRRQSRATTDGAVYYYNPFTLFPLEETALFGTFPFLFVLLWAQGSDARRRTTQAAPMDPVTLQKRFGISCA